MPDTTMGYCLDCQAPIEHLTTTGHCPECGTMWEPSSLPSMRGSKATGTAAAPGGHALAVGTDPPARTRRRERG